MKVFIIFVIVFCAVILSGCSFGYEVVIVNNSEQTIQISYAVSNEGHFDEPMTKSLEDFNNTSGIHRLWQKEVPWQVLPETYFQTSRPTRTIKISPRQAVRIETGHYNPISEERGELTDIIELRLVSEHGEMILKGKLLLGQFEKRGYTFIKTYTDELKNRD